MSQVLPPPAPVAGIAKVAVLDIGKSNVKLSACTFEGAVIETVSTPNPVLPGPPWQHHDLKALNGWVLSQLSRLCARHPIRHVIATGHGVGGCLVVDDPDLNGDGLALPMIDYEQSLPPGLAEAYAPQAGDFHDRGSAIMAGATHIARQAYWAETAAPAAFAQCRWILGLPQYWAWRLSGVASAEISYLGAQSHLWNVVEKRAAPIIAARGWTERLPPLRPAGADLGAIRPALARAHDLPADLRIHTGGHDSSFSFYRYQAAGLQDFAVISTGTWIVALADRIAPETLIEARGMTLNADVFGQTMGGALAMGGREYAAVAGTQPPDALCTAEVLQKLVAQGSMALPMFGTDTGQFSGAAGKGRLIGPPPVSAAERHALAVLYVALLAVSCGDILAPDRLWLLDGSFLRDPAFGAIVAQLHGHDKCRVTCEPYGIAAGAAALCRSTPEPLPLSLNAAPELAGLPDLTTYAETWRAYAKEYSQ